MFSVHKRANGLLKILLHSTCNAGLGSGYLATVALFCQPSWIYQIPSPPVQTTLLRTTPLFAGSLRKEWNGSEESGLFRGRGE